MNQAAPLKDSFLRVFQLAKAFNFVNTPSAEDINQTVQDLQEVQGSALIIGGIAVGYYGLERTTADVDILYKNRDTQIIQRLEKHFESVVSAESGWHELRHKKTLVRLELIPEGGLGQFGFIPFCDTVGGQNGFISLGGLIWLKMVAGRGKDEIDVIELYKLNPSGVTAVRAILPLEIHERFDALVSKARNEMDNDPYRHPEKFMKQMLPDGTIVDHSKPK